MRKPDVDAFGPILYRQSIHPMSPKRVDDNDVQIWGLDTEFWTDKESRNHLVSWQLGFDWKNGAVYHEPLVLETLVNRATERLGSLPKLLYLVTYFITAEAQFFLDNRWKISEWKGQYEFETTGDLCKIKVIDLQRWFPGHKLEAAAAVFGLKKLSYPIVEVMGKVANGERSIESVLGDPAFQDYALNDAVITGEVFRRIRRFFLERFGVDILLSRTPAGTSAAIFRSNYVTEKITQRNMALRLQSMESAWGGRVECFHRGVVKKSWMWDAFAHHPSSAIALKQLPLGTQWRETMNVKEWLSGIGGVGKVQFRFPSSCPIPCLPVMNEGMLIWPLSGVSDCTVEEARLASDLGAGMTLIKGFFFCEGTDILQHYLKDLMVLRKQAKESERLREGGQAESEMLKLMMNGIVGKLFQKSWQTDITAVQKLAVSDGIPVELAMDLYGAGIQKKPSVGTLFYPEWYAVILGYARAHIARTCLLNNTLMVSSDGVVIANERFRPPDSEIAFSLKAEGEYVAYRTKLYRVGDKVAHHAVHNADAAKVILESFSQEESAKYVARRIIKLRESWKGVGLFGSNIERDMTVSLGFDFKRKLLDGGNTAPWNSVDERNRTVGKGGDTDDTFERPANLERWVHSTLGGEG